VRADITLSDISPSDEGFVAQRTSRIRTTLVNPLTPTAFDEYIVGNCLVDEERNQCFEGPPGWNRTWFSVWTPPSDVLLTAQDDGGPFRFTQDSFHDQRVFDVFRETPPSSEDWFELDLEGTLRLQREGEAAVYTWTWWRQAKATPDLLDITVRAPEGWSIADVALMGVGMTERLMGVDAGEPVATVGSTATSVTLRGAVGRDASLRIRLVPSA
jgi:hypothetical protein